jgi:hypothetical protein
LRIAIPGAKIATLNAKIRLAGNNSIALPAKNSRFSVELTGRLQGVMRYFPQAHALIERNRFGVPHKHVSH